MLYIFNVNLRFCILYQSQTFKKYFINTSKEL